MATSSSLFCYGTLSFPEVMCAVIGTVPDSIEARLAGYACYEIYGVSYPAIIPQQGITVSGTMYLGLGTRQLKLIDRYESTQYKRLLVRVVDNKDNLHSTWSYVLAPDQYHRIKKQPWLRSRFAKNDLDKYISQHGWRRAGLKQV